MTAEERRDKCLAELWEQSEGDFVKYAALFADRFASEIRAAVEEEAMLRMDWNVRIESLEKQVAEAEENKRKAVEEAEDKVASDLTEHYHKLMTERITDAFADAAKIAESHISKKQSGSLWSRAARLIRDEIRARAAEVGQ